MIKDSSFVLKSPLFIQLVFEPMPSLAFIVSCGKELLWLTFGSFLGLCLFACLFASFVLFLPWPPCFMVEEFWSSYFSYESISLLLTIPVKGV